MEAVKSRSCFSLVFVSFSFLFFSSSVFSSIKDLKKRARDLPSSSDFFTFDSFFNIEWQPLDGVQSVAFEKAKRLYAILSPMVGHDVLSFQHMFSLINFIEEHRDMFKALLQSRPSLYIHPVQPSYPLALQVYREGAIYIHLGDLDRAKSEGSYKKFSRSIDYQSEEMVATLVSGAEKRAKSLERLLEELRFMEKNKGNGTFSSLLHADLYTVLLDSDKYSLDLIFQTPLYHGDLAHLPREETLEHSLQTLTTVFFQSAQALSKLHQMSYVHRDIKPENIFFRKSKELLVFLADFGFVQHVKRINFGASLSGSRGYVAPEVFLRRTSGNFTFEKASDGFTNDVYALGLTFGKLLYRTEYEFYSLNQKVNFIGWPKTEKTSPESKPPDVDLTQLNNAIMALKSAHIKSFPRIERNPNQVISFIKSSLEILIWKMTCPQAEDRIDLSTALQDLVTIQAYAATYLR